MGFQIEGEGATCCRRLTILQVARRNQSSGLMSEEQGTYFWKNTIIRHVDYQHFMLWRVIRAIGIGILEKCHTMTEFVFLHFSIEALVTNFYKKMDCYQKLFHCYQSILSNDVIIGAFCWSGGKANIHKLLINWGKIKIWLINLLFCIK